MEILSLQFNLGNQNRGMATHLKSNHSSMEVENKNIKNAEKSIKSLLK